MPLFTPPSALVATYRVYCLQYVHYIIKYPNYTCEFNKATLKKYSYYIMQNALYHLVNVQNGSKLIVILICNKFHNFIIRNIRLLLVIILIRVFKKLLLFSKLLLKLLL
jgi:hypothetical protein